MAYKIDEDQNRRNQQEIAESAYGQYIEWGAGPEAAKNKNIQAIKEANHAERIKKRNLGTDDYDDKKKLQFESGTF